MEEFKLIRPTKQYKEQALEYIEEFKKYNSEIHGVGGLTRYLDDYEGWLDKLEEYRVMEPNPKKVPSETFMFIRKSDNRLVGMISLRFTLNEALREHGGHIGYSIRPTERRKGYASYQLYLVLKYCDILGLKDVLITCDKTNIASASVIEKCYGVLENEVYDKIDGRVIRRYWVNVDEALFKNGYMYEKQKVI